MKGADFCATYEGDEKCLQDFRGETWKKQPALKLQAYMER